MPEIPLTPTGRRALHIGNLAMNPADIIVSTTNKPVSGLIRAVTGSSVSHAALYDGVCGVYEAIGAGGVQHRSLFTALQDDTLAVVYRVRAMSAEASSKVIAFADSLARKKAAFDVAGAAGGGMRYNPMVCVIPIGFMPCLSTCLIGAWGGFKSGDKFYCSQLVLEAYRCAGVSFIDVNPNVSVPQDIVNAYSSNKLRYVGHLLTEAPLRWTVSA